MEVLKSLENGLDHGRAAKYPFENHICRSWPLTTGQTSFRIKNCLITPFMPSYCLFALMDADELAGDVNKNGYNFLPGFDSL